MNGAKTAIIAAIIAFTAGACADEDSGIIQCGDNRCKDNILYFCRDGILAEGIQCTNDTVCDAQLGICKSVVSLRSCDFTGTQCIDSYQHQCTDGIITSTIFCAKGCASGHCVECSPGEKDCLGRKVRVCNAGKWEVSETCPTLCSEGVCCSKP